jgi:hypothetical protein
MARTHRFTIELHSKEAKCESVPDKIDIIPDGKEDEDWRFSVTRETRIIHDPPNPCVWVGLSKAHGFEAATSSFSARLYGARTDCRPGLEIEDLPRPAEKLAVLKFEYKPHSAFHLSVTPDPPNFLLIYRRNLPATGKPQCVEGDPLSQTTFMIMDVAFSNEALELQLAPANSQQKLLAINVDFDKPLQKDLDKKRKITVRAKRVGTLYMLQNASPEVHENEPPFTVDRLKALQTITFERENKK